MFKVKIKCKDGDVSFRMATIIFTNLEMKFFKLNLKDDSSLAVDFKWVEYVTVDGERFIERDQDGKIVCY